MTKTFVRPPRPSLPDQHRHSRLLDLRHWQAERHRLLRRSSASGPGSKPIARSTGTVDRRRGYSRRLALVLRLLDSPVAFEVWPSIFGPAARVPAKSPSNVPRRFTARTYPRKLMSW